MIPVPHPGAVMAERYRPRLPWMTHLVTAAICSTYLIGSGWARPGIFWDARWWWPWNLTAGVLVAAGLFALGAAVFAAVETLALQLPLRFPARVLAVVSTLIVAYFAFLPAGFRLGYDPEPIHVSLLMLLLYLLWPTVGLQLLLTAAGMRAAVGIRATVSRRRKVDDDRWDEYQPHCPVCGHRRSAHPAPRPIDWWECGVGVSENDMDQRSEEDICDRTLPRPWMPGSHNIRE